MDIKKSYYNWSRQVRGKSIENKISDDNMTEKEAREIIADLIIRYKVDIDIDLGEMLRGNGKEKEKKD